MSEKKLNYAKGKAGEDLGEAYLKNKGYKIVVLKNKILPDYIEKDSSIVKIAFKF